MVCSMHLVRDVLRWNSAWATDKCSNGRDYEACPVGAFRDLPLRIARHAYVIPLVGVGPERLDQRGWGLLRKSTWRDDVRLLLSRPELGLGISVCRCGNLYQFEEMSVGDKQVLSVLPCCRLLVYRSQELSRHCGISWPCKQTCNPDYTCAHGSAVGNRRRPLQCGQANMPRSAMSLERRLSTYGHTMQAWSDVSGICVVSSCWMTMCKA